MGKDFSLLETILYEPVKGFYLLKHHLARLQNAVKDFRAHDSELFVNAPSDEYIVKELNAKIPLDNNYYRVRLLLNVNSEISIEHTPLAAPQFSFESLDEAAKGEPLVNVVLDTKAFNLPNDDPYILHKTTKREMYDGSRARTNCQWHSDKNEPFDVILWNSNNEITETSITNIAIQFKEDGKRIWKTPKVSCGLLPGVFRTHLLAQNPNIVEGVITIDDIKHAQKEGYPIICFNSVRKAYRVQLLTIRN